MSYFLDANVCIYYLNGSSENILRKLTTLSASEIKIPSIVAAELFFGAEKSAKREFNLSRVRKFLSLFEIVPFNAACVEIYGQIRAKLERQGSPIGGNDLVIAAIVLRENGVLATRNIKEFERVENMKIENWF